MNILDLLSQNFGHASRTRTPDNNVPYPVGYRGRLNHTVELCTACGTCIYVCSPGAITTEDPGGALVTWNYAEDRCTFCSYCVTYCPTHALSIEAVAPLPMMDRAQHYMSHTITLQPCRECGQPARSIPEVVLIGLYGHPLPEEIAAARGLCEHCRQRITGQRFMRAIAGEGGDYAG